MNKKQPTFSLAPLWQQLQNALTTQDAMMINHALSRWLNESPLTHAEREQVQQTLNTLHENKFSLNSQTCDYQALNTLIKRLSARSAKAGSQNSALLSEIIGLDTLRLRIPTLILRGEVFKRVRRS
ncbi:hypothetical protein ACT691_20840 [Vibrio metschnikovii]